MDKVWELIRKSVEKNELDTLSNNICLFNAERLHRRASALASFYRGELVGRVR